MIDVLIKVKILIIFCSGLFIVLPVKANRVLLPEPQEVSYTGKSVYFSEANIRFENEQRQEDIYVQKELTSVLENAGIGVVKSRKRSSNLNIVLKRSGAMATLPQIDDKSGPNSREYYEISIHGNKVMVISPSSAGLFYGVQTLRQLISKDDKGVFLPEVSIIDWPEMVYRGFMMDMTHMQFPTIQEIKEQLDFLSRWKVNQYYFYSEANIELDGFPLLMSNARYTKEQVREVIDYAKKKFIDVVPNLNLYGHLHDFFKYEHYMDLSATPYGWEFNSDHPKVEGIVNNWIEQFTTLFTSPFFHIGYDETYLIRYEAERLGVPTDELYLKMLNRTIKQVESKKKTVLFYADRLQLFPEGISKVEGNPIVVAWHYTLPKDKTYDNELKPFFDNNIPLIVQGGVLNYRWIYPDTDISFENNLHLKYSAQKFNSKGFIVSAWTDAWSSLIRQARPDMVHGAVISWQKKPIEKEDFFYRLCYLQYPDSLAQLIYDAHIYLSEAATITKKYYRLTADSIWANPFSPHALSVYRENKEEIRRCRLLTEKAEINLQNALLSDIDTSTFQAMLVGAKLLNYFSTRYLYAGRIADLHVEFKERRDKRRFGATFMETINFYSSLSTDIHDMIVDLKDVFSRAWLNEYTNYRLAIPMARFDRELHNWMTAQRKLQRTNSVAGNESLRPLNEILNMDWD